MLKILVLLKKELLQFLRNTPLLLIVLYSCTLDVYLASEFTMDLKNYPIAIYDLDASQKSRELIARIRPPYFKIYRYIHDESEINKLILQGEVGVVLLIPKNFQNSIDSYRTASVQVILDATTSNTAELAANYLNQIIASFSWDIMVNQWQIPENIYKQLPVVECRNRFAFNQNLTDKWAMCLQEFFTILTLIAILLPATAMVNEKQFGTIEQLMVTPLKPYEIMLAKVLPMVGVFIVASFISIYTIMMPIVGVPLRGSFLDFLLLTIIFCFTSSGLGMLISTVSHNLSETVLLTILVLFPIMFLSGAWVPPEAMPLWMQVIMVFSPLKYYLNIGMAIFLKGNSLLFMWKDFLALSILGLGIFMLGAARFRKMFG